MATNGESFSETTIATNPASFPPHLDGELSTANADQWDRDNTSNWCLFFLHHKNALLFFFFVFLGIIGISLAALSDFFSQEDIFSQVSLSNEAYLDAIESAAMQISDPLTFLDPFSPQSKAINWLVYTDTVVTSIEFPTLLQRYALMVFFFATNGSRWAMVQTWDGLSSIHECNFDGIDCDSKNNVVALSMVARRLSGTIPNELSALTSLETLNLAKNDLRGNIPSSIYVSCSKIKRLDLGFNPLSSTLSSEIGSLSALQKLLLTGTNLYGTLPESLKRLKRITTVSLSQTSLEGEFFDFMLSWPYIQRVVIGQTLFHGLIPPDIGKLTLLDTLFMDGTRINVTFPTEMGLLTNLYRLRVHTLGSHSGSIPTEIGNLSALEHLDIQGSRFTGSIPTEVGKLLLLKYMQISGGLIMGALPSEIGNLSSLERLDVSQNKIEGAIPAEIGDLEYLTEFSIESNKFEGCMPATFCSIQTILYDCTLKCECCACTCLVCNAI